MIRNIRYLIGGLLIAIGFLIIEKEDLLDLVNSIKERLNNDINR